MKRIALEYEQSSNDSLSDVLRIAVPKGLS
jgi:hypothetical protein